jgi:diaminobutyrate acetyltransferase
MMNLHNPHYNDYQKMHRLTGRIDGLVQHPAHVYKIMCDHFGNSIFLADAEDQPEGELSGLMLGIISQKMDNLLFIWQIGVDKRVQGKGLGSRLLEKTIRYACDAGYRGLMATVETANIQSQKLFEKFNFGIATEKYQNEHAILIETKGKAALKNYYGSGSDQIFYELLTV